MIRTTISRIKRVWAITFSPGLLRGDMRYGPGKFQILSSPTQSSPPRRSKSSNGVYKDRQRKTKHGSAAGCEEKDVFEDYLSADMRANDPMHGAPPLYQTTSACRCDECNKIIAEIFGEETMPGQRDHDLKRKLLANIAQVNITDSIDSDKYVTDKAQLGLFQQTKKEDDDSLPEFTKKNIDSESTTKTKDNYKSVLCHEIVLMDDPGGKKSKRVDVDAHQMYTNLYDVDPEEYQCNCTDANKSPFPSKRLKDRNVDAYWKDVYETAVGENSVYCEHTLSIDEDTLNVYKMLKNTDSKFDDTSLESRRLKRSPRELEKMIAGEQLLKDCIKNQDKERQVIKASTEKQDDEKLIQKVEHIDEAPLVEAEKSKVEGSQIAPRVLRCVGKPEVLNSLDEVAKRCLTTPQNQIDEILLKEMEKLGIPLTVQRSNCGLKIGDNKADTVNKPEKIRKEEEIELDYHDMNSKPQRSRASDKSINIAETKELEVNPLKAVTQFHTDLNRTKIDDDSNSKEKANLESQTETNVSEANCENKSGWLYWRVKNSQQQEPKRSGTSEQENYNNFTDKIWQKNQLDPKHVLTCNETCAISPKPLIQKNLKDFEGTESMYEQQHVHRDEYIKQKPLLEDGETFPTRTDDNPQYTIKTDYLNPSQTIDYTDLMKDRDTITKAVDSGKHQIPTTDSTFNIIPPELPRREVDLGPKDDFKDTEDLTETSIEAVDSEQLQLTTEQLQAASQQLHATCEHLQATTEQLQAATIQLQATSNHLCDSSDKLFAASENLYTTTEKLQFTSENLRDTTEQIGCDKQMFMNKISSYPTRQSWGTTKEAERAVSTKDQKKSNEQFINDTIKSTMNTSKPTVSTKDQKRSNEQFINDTMKSTMNTFKPRSTLSVNPATAALISKAVSGCMNDSKTGKTLSQQAKTKSTEKEKTEDKKDDDDTDLKEFDSKCFSPNIEGWAQQATTINPSVPMAEDLPPIKPLPEINDKVKLSEVMKIVRERNRLVDCHEATVLVKPRKSIPPLSQPMANTSPAFKMPSLPQVKSFPRVCVPKRKKPTTRKFSRCNLETLGLDQNASLIAPNESRECLDAVSLDQQQAIDLTLVEDDLITDLADDFILKLNFLGNILQSSYKRGQAEVLEAAVLAKTRHLAKILRSQDYEPWSPIPSWPYPKKPKRHKLQCPKDGCKIPPPLSIEDRPCRLKPCETFPTFPRRTFSLLDCYPTSLSDHKIVDVGDF